MTEKTLTNKISSKIKRGLIVLVVLFVAVLVGTSVYFFTNLTPVDANAQEQIEFVLEKGWGVSKIATELEKSDLIKNAFIFKVYVKLNDNKNFQAGTYLLSKSMSVDEIIESLEKGRNIVDNSISITFVEGKKIPYFVKKVADNFDYTNDEIMNTLSSEEYLNKLIKKYWFIEEDILNKNIYYPLEGYLFPDTYEFKRDASIEEIFGKMLDAMENNLNNYKDEIALTNQKVSSLLTLASMVELEAVRPEDRGLVAGVFNNRLKANIPLGSDVTTYYAVKKEMTDKLYNSDLNSCSAYNTRGTCAISGLPVGPICNPSLSSIVASITPTESNYYYFVADTSNKVYFSTSASEQDTVIKELKRQGLWPE